jgi:transcriptional regulator of acetoin/glycerol metabolism
MGALMEASGAMHIVKDIPPDDAQKLHSMARVFLHRDMDLYDMTEFAENAYKIGRETEARRHQSFAIGSLADMEYIAIVRAMETTGFNPIKAAGVLKIGRTTMYRKLKLFKINYGQGKREEQATD